MEQHFDRYFEKYRPVWTSDGKLDVRVGIAHCFPHTDAYMISTYVLSVPKGAGKRGGDISKALRIDALCMRFFVPKTMTEADQLNTAEVMLTITAGKLGSDYKLRLPIRPKRCLSEEEVARKLKEHKWLSKT